MSIFTFTGKEWPGEEGDEFGFLIECFPRAAIPISRRGWCPQAWGCEWCQVTRAARAGQEGTTLLWWPGKATKNPRPKAAGSKRHLEEALLSVPGGEKICVGIQKVPSPLPSKQLPSNCHNFGSRGIFAEGPAFYTVVLPCRLRSKRALITP